MRAREPAAPYVRWFQMSDPQNEKSPSSDAQILRPASKSGFFIRIRTYFLTGLVVAAPIGITIYLTRWFIEAVDNWFLPLIPDRYQPEQYIPFSIPGLGVVIALVALTLLGALTANFFGRQLLNWGERIVDRMPVVRSIYGALKQIFETVASQSNTSFREAALIEYPRRGLYALVFITTKTTGEVLEKAPTEDGLVSVFLPTTPNPTSGFLLFVPRADIIPLEMSVEEAAKLIISAGLVEPGNNKQGKDRAKNGAPVSPTEDT